MPASEHICFDRILPADLARPHRGRLLRGPGGQPTRAAFEIAKLWPNGSTITLSFLSGSPSQHATVKQFANQWPQFANLKFNWLASGEGQVRIDFQDDGSWSYIGTDALGIAAGQATMNFGWLDEGVVLHEFGHMIGMIHEHQNPIDNLIQWNKPVVNAALAGPPNRWSQATIDHNMYAKYAVTQINGSSFDSASVMLYSFPASWTLNGFHSNPNQQLSQLDRDFAARVYPGAGQPVAPAAVNLPVAAGHQAAIGQPGEEDLYRFKADTAARYVIETSGPTDVVMTLFSSTGTKLAQDDDGGAGSNARIAADLIPGEYTVQVRHFNASGGTGQYSILVSKA